ncbi:uncharacterized protein N0V89_005240 [Didymosphaeria variabile]|uniref:Uncharacterized protein n=1 Tax=Didymosphaeria variabile TaxID=1932322 RepID=A0A9W9CB37_9PLEO|nr:uncharacterized protein N0V89_005240 [Didymosphaeria variabile]KAJ4353510.1 hypothetical protein N0V89_005240 [Didymosphaeria variabile]
MGVSNQQLETAFNTGRVDARDHTYTQHAANASQSIHAKLIKRMRAAPRSLEIRILTSVLQNTSFEAEYLGSRTVPVVLYPTDEHRDLRVTPESSRSMSYIRKRIFQSLKNMTRRLPQVKSETPVRSSEEGDETVAEDNVPVDVDDATAEEYHRYAFDLGSKAENLAEFERLL